jgi:hypothetical protein
VDVVTPPSFVQSGIIRYSIRIELFVLCVAFGVIEQLVTHLDKTKLRYVEWNRDEYFQVLCYEYDWLCCHVYCC